MVPEWSELDGEGGCDDPEDMESMEGARRLLGGEGDSGSLLGLAHDEGLNIASCGRESIFIFHHVALHYQQV